MAHPATIWHQGEILVDKTKTVSTHWKSSMEKIRLSENKDGTYSLTFIDDISHGYRTFTIAKEDLEKILN